MNAGPILDHPQNVEAAVAAAQSSSARRLPESAGDTPKSAGDTPAPTLRLALAASPALRAGRSVRRVEVRLLLSILLFVRSTAPATSLELAAVRKAAKYSAEHRGTSFLVVQKGKTLLEEYPGKADSEKPQRIYSGTKAFWNLAALAATDDRLLDLDERVANTLSSWRKDPRKSRVTIRQLLDFSCGLAPGFSLQVNEYGNRDKTALGLPIVAEPGKAFIYGPAALQVFHALLQEKLKKKTPTEYLERRVLRRIKLGPQRYLDDRAGNPLLAAGFVLTARQWARMGQLVLDRGKPVVRPETLAQSWRGSPANPAFSLGWWNNRAAPNGREFDFEEMLHPEWPQQNWRDACFCRDAPRDLVACIGSGYQRLYVVPSLDLIVVRQGNGGRFSDAHFLRLLLGK
jgi:CubicO group peptidase (beta-lactamase class C family)